MTDDKGERKRVCVRETDTNCHTELPSLCNIYNVWACIDNSHFIMRQDNSVSKMYAELKLDSFKIIFLP
jgi:hypothetical protein